MFPCFVLFPLIHSLTNDLYLLCVFVVCCELKRFNLSVEQIKEISERSEELVEKLFEETKKLEEFVARADQMQTESIDDFKKAYEVIMLH